MTDMLRFSCYSPDWESRRRDTPFPAPEQLPGCECVHGRSLRCRAEIKNKTSGLALLSVRVWFRCHKSVQHTTTPRLRTAESYVLVRPRTDVKKTMGKALLVHTYLTVPTFISNPYPQLYQLPTTPTPTLGHAGAAKVRAGAERYNGLA